MIHSFNKPWPVCTIQKLLHPGYPQGIPINNVDCVFPLSESTKADSAARKKSAVHPVQLPQPKVIIFK